MKTKLLWKDVDGNLKQPQSTWKIGNAEQWFEELLGVPAGTVMLRGPRDADVGSLRVKK